jgi:hypothetical protein
MFIAVWLQQSDFLVVKHLSRLAARRWAVYDLSDELVTSEALSHAASPKGLICLPDLDQDLLSIKKRPLPA